MTTPFDSQFSAIRNRIIYYANLYGIDSTIGIWQIWQESKFKPRASSGKANGIAQFTPATARRFNVDVWDIESSLNGWGKYMRWLLNRFNNNYSFALAGYNAGEGNVDKYKGIPPFSETQNYVKTILQSASNSTGLTKFGNNSIDLPKFENTFEMTPVVLFGFFLIFIILDD